MSDFICPYCYAEFNYDEVHTPEQDEQVEIDCPCCKKTFLATAVWELNFYDSVKAPCLNSEEHKMIHAPLHPNYFPNRMRCEYCGYTIDGKFIVDVK